MLARETKDFFDVAIVVALKQEFDWLRERIRAVSVPGRYLSTLNISKYQACSFSFVDHNGGERKAIVVCVGAMAPMRSMEATKTILGIYPIQLVINVGIAGSISDDV